MKRVWRWYWESLGQYTDWREVVVVALFFVLCALATHCNAQDTRWRLIQGTDSIVAVPLQDLRTAAGYRIAKNVSQRQCAWELIERGKELSAMREERNARDRAMAAMDGTITLMREQNDDYLKRAEKWQKKAKRRNPVVWMGIGAGAMLLIQNALK